MTNLTINPEQSKSMALVFCAFCCAKVQYSKTVAAIGKVFCSLICADDFSERNPVEREEVELEEVED